MTPASTSEGLILNFLAKVDETEARQRIIQWTYVDFARDHFQVKVSLPFPSFTPTCRFRLVVMVEMGQPVDTSSGNVNGVYISTGHFRHGICR